MARKLESCNRLDQKIIGMLEGGLRLVMKLVHKDKNPKTGEVEKDKPFFASLFLKDCVDHRVVSADGAIFSTTKKTPGLTKDARGDLRVGCYNRGCSASEEIKIHFPEDNSPIAFKRDVWRQANQALYDAVKDLDLKIKESRGVPKEFQSFLYFSKEKPVESFKPKKAVTPDLDYWEDVLRKVSDLFVPFDDIIDPQVEFAHSFEKRYYVNSEGTRIIDCSEKSKVLIYAGIVDGQNLVFDDYEVFWSLRERGLPTQDQLMEAAGRVIKRLFEVRDAPFEEPDIYPIIASGENVGVIAHEAFGHGAEAHRLIEQDEGASGEWFDYDHIALIFKDKMGKVVAPPFLSIYDDPTLSGYHGSYEYDEEGVPAQRVCIVEDGILKNLLHSRESAGKMSKELGEAIKSNGHARASGINDPVARMSNLLVESKDNYSMDELKEMLFKACKEQGKKYGLLIEGARGGHVDTEDNIIRVFPQNIFRLYPNGRIKRVKGLYLSSTPYQIIKNIKATTGEYGVYKGNCAAESGWVPASERAPDAFINSVEFGRVPRSDYQKRYPVLSKPPKP